MKSEPVKVTSTSRDTAKVDDIELRETATTRLIFRPLLVNNVKDETAAVKGTFIFQRKGQAVGWEDHKVLDLTHLKAEEWIKLELHSDEVLTLFQELQALYQLFEHEGIPQGEVSYIRAASGITALLNASDRDLELLLEDASGQGQELLMRFINWFLSKPDQENILNLLEDLDSEQLGHLSELAGIKALRAILQTWNSNQANGEEDFWQRNLGENGFVLSQAFPVPVVIVKDKAYVSGKRVTNKGGNIVDFLLKNEISQNAILIEIKTPKTPLLSSNPYRQKVYSISPEISGAIAQVLNYRQSLVVDGHRLQDPEEGIDFDAFEPIAVVIAGNSTSELTDNYKRQSFELFRAQLRHVQLITYDELFGRIGSLVKVLQGEAEKDFEDADIDLGSWLPDESAAVQEEDDILF